MCLSFTALSACDLHSCDLFSGCALKSKHFSQFRLCSRTFNQKVTAVECSSEILTAWFKFMFSFVALFKTFVRKVIKNGKRFHYLEVINSYYTFNRDITNHN